MSCENTRYSTDIACEKKVEKTCKKRLTLAKRNGIISKLTRERKQNKKKNKKVLDKAKWI